MKELGFENHELNIASVHEVLLYHRTYQSCFPRGRYSYHNQEVVEHEHTEIFVLQEFPHYHFLCGKAAPAATPATVAPTDSAENAPVSTLACFPFAIVMSKRSKLIQEFKLVQKLGHLVLFQSVLD